MIFQNNFLEFESHVFNPRLFAFDRQEITCIKGKYVRGNLLHSTLSNFEESQNGRDIIDMIDGLVPLKTVFSGLSLVRHKKDLCGFSAHESTKL